MQQDDTVTIYDGYTLKAFSEAEAGTILGFETMSRKYRHGWHVRVLQEQRQYKVNRSFLDHDVTGLHDELVNVQVLVTERIYEHSVMGTHVSWETYPQRQTPDYLPQPIVLMYFYEDPDRREAGEPEGHAVPYIGRPGDDPFDLLTVALATATA